MRGPRRAVIGVPLAIVATIGLVTAVAAAPLIGGGTLAKPHGGRTVEQICSGGVLDAGKKLQRFVNRLKRGETGCLKRGVYEGGVDMKTRNVTLRSFPGRRATISGGQIRINPSARGATIKRLRLVSDQFSPLIYASRAVIADNEITNRHTDICIHIDQYPGTQVPTGVIIQRNRIHDCGRMPANNHDHGIYVGVANRTIIRDNLIYDNADRGIQLYPRADRTSVTGNVIDGNGQGVIIGGNSSNNVIEGNVISNSIIRHNVESSDPRGDGNVVRRNCLWSPINGYYGGDPPHSGIMQGHPGFTISNNVVANPRFADRRDFRVADGSPCSAMGAGPG